VVKVVRLIDHQHDRPLALSHQVAKVALAPLGLLGDLHLGAVAGREVIEQRLDERRQRRAPLVARQRLRDRDRGRACQLVLDAPQEVRLA
jgi:hypothetical protein